MNEVDQMATTILRLIGTDEEALGDARATANTLLQEHVGPDHKVLSMSDFRSALVQALLQALAKGREEAI